MKKIYVPFVLFLGCIFLNSCSEDEFTESGELISYEDRIENLEKLSSSVFDLNAQVILKSSDLNGEDALVMLTPVIEQSKEIFHHLGVSKKNLNLNDEEEDLVFAAFGIAMVIEYEKRYKADNEQIMAKGGFGECLADVLGFTALATLAKAGLELYAGEVAAGYAVDAAAAKAFRKAALQAAGKIISRFAGPIGAAIMVGEFAFCLAS